MVRNASIGIRVELGLKEAAERAAKDDRRTVASLIEKVLTEWLEAKGYLPKGDAPAGARAQPAAMAPPATRHAATMPGHAATSVPPDGRLQGKPARLPVPPPRWK
jgi:hypothetical protein